MSYFLPVIEMTNVKFNHVFLLYFIYNTDIETVKNWHFPPTILQYPEGSTVANKREIMPIKISLFRATNIPFGKR